MIKTGKHQLPPIARTSAGLRDALFDELDGLRDGSTNPGKANAVAKLADQIVNTVRMEMDVERHVGRLGDAPRIKRPGLSEPLALGA